MILARDSITISHLRDIEATYWFWQLKSSTAAAPSQPTAAQAAAFIANHTTLPTGWVLSEPTYTSGSTNSLYRVELTEYTDGTGSWSEVSKDSSYEAAKEAYNKSVAAQEVADQAKSTADTALVQSTEYIVGTQTAATGSWKGVTTDTELIAGKTIAYKLPFAGSGDASLTLELADGSNTGAIPVYLNTTRVTTHFGAGAVINMTYDGTNWRASSIPNTNTNTYDRTLYSQAVKAASAGYKGTHIICGTSAGYINIAAGAVFDLTYPLLYYATAATTTITSGKTANNHYLTIPGVSYSVNGTIESGGTYNMLYLKGTVQDNSFTIAASPFMTTKEPTSEDGYCYIPLGSMSSATAGRFVSNATLYAFKDGAFGPVSIREASEARKTATSYLTDVSNGVFIHAEGTPEDPTASTAKGVRITDDVDIIRNGESVAKYGESVRIGNGDNAAYLLISKDAISAQTAEDRSYFRVSDAASTELKWYHTVKQGELNTLMFALCPGQYGAPDIKRFSIDGKNYEDTLPKQLGTDGVVYVNFYSYKSQISVDTTLVVIFSCGAYAEYIGGLFDFGYRDELTTTGLNSAVIGTYNSAEGVCSLAAGEFSRAIGDYSFAMGVDTKASGNRSHAEGDRTIASGDYSHAEGNKSVASGRYSHAEGSECEALGYGGAHAGGLGSQVINGYAGFAHGYYVTASPSATDLQPQAVFGAHNELDMNAEYAFIIGNGSMLDTTHNTRSNAFAVSWTGNIKLALDTNAASGSTDGDLYAAISALGWASDVIE